MSDYIKYMYREYLEGRTRIKKVNEDQPLFPNTGAGLLIQKNKLTDDWTALNVSDGHYEEESFNHEALAAAFLQGANMGQLRMLRVIFCASMQSPTSIVDSIDPVGTTNGSITNARKRKTAATTAPKNVMNFRIFFRIEVIPVVMHFAFLLG